MPKNNTEITLKDVEEVDIRLELMQQQQGDLLYLEEQGIDTTPFQRFLDDMISDESMIKAHYDNHK